MSRLHIERDTPRGIKSRDAYDINDHMSCRELISDMLAELHYLTWFAQNADLGPADGDVQMIMQDEYKQQTGNDVPENWRYE